MKQTKDRLIERFQTLNEAGSNVGLVFSFFDIKKKRLEIIYGTYGVDKNLIYKNLPDSMLEKVIPMESQEAFMNHYQTLMAGKDDTAEFWCYNARGIKRYYRTSFHVHYKDGEPDYAGGILYDYTEEHISELQLAFKYENEVKEIQDVSKDYMCGLRINLTVNRLEFISGNALDKTAYVGMSQEEHLKHLRRRLVNARDIDSFMETFNRETLIEKYNQGINQMVADYKMIDQTDTEQYISFHISVQLHPITRNFIAFVTEQNVTREKYMRDALAYLTKKQEMYITRINAKTGRFVFCSHSNLRFMPSQGSYNEKIHQLVNRFEADESKREEWFRNVSLETVVKELETKETYEIIQHFDSLDSPNQIVLAQFSYMDEKRETIILVQKDVTHLMESQKSN